MKKRILAVALAATMALTSVISASAATISGGFWTAWTEGYEVTDTVEFDIDVIGGDNNWNNVAAVFVNVATTGTVDPSTESEDYKEYAVVRTDSWGWGGGDNASVSGNAITYTSDIVDADEDGDTWDDFVAIMADAHIDATVTKSGDDVTLAYAITGANGASFNYTASFSEDTSEGLYVFFVCDGSEVTVEKVEAAADDGAADDGAADDGAADDGAADDGAADDKEAATTAKPSTSTGDVATTAMIVAMVGAAAAVVVLKKRVTE